MQRIPVFGEQHKDSVGNLHSVPECCPENAHQFVSSLVYVISDFIVKLKALSFLPLAPQLLEMFFCSQNHMHMYAHKTRQALLCPVNAALPSIVCYRGLHS